MRSQGFGKRSSAVGMPRPKKAKLQYDEESGQPSATAITAATANEEVTPPALKEQDAPIHDDSFEVVDKGMLKDAAAVTKMARASVKEAAVEVRLAEARLRHERRLDEEREQRWWAADRRAAERAAAGLFAARAGLQVAGEGPEGAPGALRGPEA